ncbi:MAG TPA: transposase, partial [Allosphingosinicella sp.]
MPRLIGAHTAETLELEDLVEMLESGPFDPEDEECFASWGPALRKLGNNRRFLADIAIAELKDRVRGQ